jgi:hypothetical protein
MSGSAPKPDAEPLWAMLLVVGLCVFVGSVLWWMFRIQILDVMRYVRLSELWILGLFTDQQNSCYEWLKQATIIEPPTNNGVTLTVKCFGNLDNLPHGQTANDYFNLSGTSMGVIGRRVAYYMHIPLALFFVYVAGYIIFISPRNKFKTRHTLETFIKTQAKMWPVIAPIVNFKPANLSARVPGTKIPDKLPPFAEPLSPEEWIAWHRIPMQNGIPDREAARRAFVLQLGPRWSGIKDQPPYIRAIYAACALKGAQKREQSDNLLGRLSLCWSIERGFNMSPDLYAEIDKALKDPEIGGVADEIAAKYAYRTTALLAVLKWSRWMGGVLASAQFLWLRAVDRNLWYPMNNLGRRSFHAEGSGAMAHFMAEENAKKPLPIPRVDTAIVALNQFLAEPDKHPMPIPPREEPAAKK